MTRAKDISKIVTDADLSGTLDVTGAVTAGGLTMDTGGNSTHTLEFGANRTSDSQALGIIRASWNSTVVSQINLSAGDDTTNKDNGQIFFRTAEAGTTANRLRIEENGDISFYEDTGTTPKLFWDASAESLGIGTSSPYTLLELSSTDPILRFNDSNGGTDTKNFEIRYVGTSSPDIDGLYFRTVNDANSVYSDKMVVLGSGNVGIGTSSPETILHVRDTSAIMRLVSDTNSTSGVDFGDTADTNIGRLLYDHTDNSMRFTTNTSERMRIDSSGNVGIGKSSFGSISTDGFWWESASNYLALSANGTSPIYMNRNGSDGGLINFYKSGTNVGNIGTFGSALYISSPDGTDAGLRVGNSTVVPVTTTGGLRDNAIDLGSASARWKDLYLSGGVYLGGTGSANKLDDFEEGNWSPSVQDYGGTATIGNANYTKIGRVVHASASIVLDGTSDASQFRINGLPFTSLNTANNVFGGFVSYSNSTFTDNIYLLVGSNDTSIFLYEPGGTGFTYNDLGANKQIRFVVTYFTA